MHHLNFGSLILLLLVSLSIESTAQAQNSSQSPTPNVYLDCNRCSFDYVRTNIDFVNYVRDQADADIYLRITDAQTGSGREYTLDFRGIPPFSERIETLTYRSLGTATPDEERTGLMRYIRVGLVPFLSETVVMEGLDVIQDSPVESSSPQEVIDQWNNWVFEVDLRTSFDKEQTESNYEIRSGLEAERITENWKMDYGLDIELDRTDIELSDGTRQVNRDWWRFDSFVAYSFSTHFSLGLFTEASASKTNNILINLEASPAVEYSFFPYGDFQERRWVLQYRITPSYRNYDQATVFLKNHEIVSQQVLSHQLRFDQPWGRINLWMSASSYLHDLSLNRFRLNPYFSIRITRGLSVFLNGRYQIINDQISLPAEDITDTERLLGERQQATSYQFWLSFGFSYTFGSMYSNIVNPRF